MSIASELSALNGYILGAYDEINDKGGTVPANKNMANLATAIAGIPSGGGGGGAATIEGFGVISGTYTPATTVNEVIVMSYADFLNAVGGTMPATVLIGIFNPSTSITNGFSNMFGFHRVKTSTNYYSSGSVYRGSMAVTLRVYNPTEHITDINGNVRDGVWAQANCGSAGYFQAGVTYTWFILWK